MLNEILNLNIFGFFLIFARMGTALSLMPGFSATYVSARTRLVIALAISFVLAPVLIGSLPGIPSSVPGIAIMIVGEIIVGAFLGTLARILMGALQTAGTFIAYMSSIANAFVQDPITEQQSSVIASFLGILGMVLIFVTNLHHLMLKAVVDSYTLFVPGQPLLAGDVSLMIARRVADSFALGVQMSAPFIIIGFAYYMGLGLLTRLMPNMPIFFVGMPLQIIIQFSVLSLALSGMMMVFLSRFESEFTAFSIP